MRPILDRMNDCLRQLQERYPKRRPKAFYLRDDDWLAFKGTEPGTIRTMFGNNPPRPRLDLEHKGVPVREFTGKGPGQSRLYDDTTTGRPLPQ